MLFLLALSAWLLLIRLGVGSPTRPEQWFARAITRRRSPRNVVRR